MNSINADIRRSLSAKTKRFYKSYYPISLVVIIIAIILTRIIADGDFWDVVCYFWFIFFLVPIILLFHQFILNSVSKFFIKRLKLTINEENAFGSYGLFIKKEFSLPIEHIVNISISDSVFDKLRSGKTIVLSTSSTTMKFPYVHNSDEILKFTLERIKQYKSNYGKINQVQPQQNVTALSDANEIEKFKKLLDDGVITQEEFDAKKKQILGL
ncbi:MAG: SHOCT domain-containing protein [Clostridiales bacterium]|nr:SHOCT domain-containing protein [Clostridiales bacterium]